MLVLKDSTDQIGNKTEEYINYEGILGVKKFFF